MLGIVARRTRNNLPKKKAFNQDNKRSKLGSMNSNPQMRFLILREKVRVPITANTHAAESV